MNKIENRKHYTPKTRNAILCPAGNVNNCKEPLAVAIPGKNNNEWPVTSTCGLGSSCPINPCYSQSLLICPRTPTFTSSYLQLLLLFSSQLLLKILAIGQASWRHPDPGSLRVQQLFYPEHGFGYYIRIKICVIEEMWNRRHMCAYIIFELFIAVWSS